MSLTERDLEGIEERLERRGDGLEDAIILMSQYLPGSTPARKSHVTRRVRKVLGREGVAG